MEAYLSDAFDPARLEAELRNPDSDFFFLFKDGQLAGYLKINDGPAQTDRRDPQALEIERVYIRQSFQGMGLGKMLIEYALQIARQRGKPRAWLGVWEKNVHAIGFYERLGFVKAGMHSFFMGDEEQSDFVMKMELKKRFNEHSAEYR